MSKDDPLRLKQSGATPPTLVRALEALRKGANETARLERVAGKLGPLLDAAPNAVSVARAGRSKVTTLKLIIGGLALLTPGLWLVRGELSEKSQPGALPNERATGETLVPEASVEVAALPEPALVAPDTTGQAKALTRAELAYRDRGRPGQSAKAPGRERPQPSAARATGSARALTANPTQPGPEAAPASARPEPSASAANAEPNKPSVAQPTAANAEANKPSALQPTAANAEASPTGPAAPSEAKLLSDARTAMASDPTLALQRLAEHKKLYPKGVLVPEREVLAIEALRSLGRNVEADARLVSFKAHYPNSFHLQRLQR